MIGDMRSGAYFSRAWVLGLIVGFLGLAALPFLYPAEENYGLCWLFKRRGVRQPPDAAVIVSLDKTSADRYGLPEDPYRWPRCWHARLIDALDRADVAVIVFDILFLEGRDAQDDLLLAEAIRRAGNVVLCACLKKDRIPLTDQSGRPIGVVHLEKSVRPLESLRQSAMACAPFPLPKVPVRMNQYWLMKKEAGDTPTLPVVAFQIYAMGCYPDFFALAQKVDPAAAAKLLCDWGDENHPS